ncbi:MAG: PHP domain-containing protein [Spirochaetes bacterium]|nr:PHP domain-containing protein [Spirochaetota bacterium]
MEGSIKTQREIKADLHIHSTLSDGTYTPYEIIDLSSKQGLMAISITDHDDFSEDSLAAYAQKKDIIFIPAIEFSTKFTNVHILGYDLDWEKEQLKNFLTHQKKERKKAVLKMCEKSKDKGLPVSAEEILEKTREAKSIGRPHLADIMVKKGYVKNLYEAFKKYLYTGGPLFEDYEKYHHKEIIQLIKNCHGLAVLAHPGLIPRYTQDCTVEEIIDCGLDGLEVYYPRHTSSQINQFLTLCKKHDLGVTGGSDFHGEVKPDIKMGQAGLTAEEFTTLHQRFFSHYGW